MKRFLTLVIFVVSVIAVIQISINLTAQTIRLPAEVLVFDDSMVPQQQLNDGLLKFVQGYGLKDQPTSVDTALMTLGSYFTLTDQISQILPSGMSYEDPVYIYQVTGTIPEFSLPGPSAGRTDIKTVAIVVNARNGDLISVYPFADTSMSLNLAFIPMDESKNLDLTPLPLPTLFPYP